MTTVLDVRELRVTVRGTTIVDDVSLRVGLGETLGLAGESGCGKTTTALALMRLLPPSLEIEAQAMTLTPPGEDPIRLDRRTERGMDVVRGRHLSLVFQGAMNTLDPVMRVDRQLIEAIRTHERGTTSAAARARARDLLDQVGIPATRAAAYPHQLSGGQRQRAMIALALACGPCLVIADEPTTALDVMTQAQVLALLERLRRERAIAFLMISHDLSVLAQTCDRVAVMYAGRIVESGPVKAVFSQPQHPYTKRLLGAFPEIGGERALAPPIPGHPPDPGDRPSGCPFRSRCDYAVERCAADLPLLREIVPEHSAACHFAPWQSWPQPAPRDVPAAGQGEGTGS